MMVQRMKGFLLVLAVGLLNPTYGEAGPAYPSEIDHLPPPNSRFESSLTEQISRTAQGKHPGNRRIASGPPPSTYLFTSDQGFDQVKTALSQKGIVWESAPLEKFASPKFRNNPEIHRKMVFGRYGSWWIALATHFYNRQTKQWMGKVTVYFTKIE